ncbi:hypothetical protein LQZ19_02530 [Treponema primitia]|uniref:hypothetical protein n=1 Tax=Treponema primitia TaxID=88058 RepID=UPI0039809B1A
MKRIKRFALIISLTSIFLIAAACTGTKAIGSAAAPEDPPIITSATYQHNLYNGKPQPIEAAAAKAGAAPFIITYYPSLEALEKDEGGTTETPSAVGDYYVRIERPAGNGYARGRDIPVEYHIQKAFVTITAEEKQTAVYDGQPKTVKAAADVPVDLVFTYFPSETARRQGVAGNGQPSGGSNQAPVEAGVYYVVVSFPGDRNYRDAAKDVELAITSPQDN